MTRKREVLTSQQVEEIRKRHREGESIRSIAKTSGVGPTQVFRIVTGVAWRKPKKPK